MSNPRITTTCTYDDGRTMSRSDQRWYLWLGRIAYVAAALTLATLAAIVVLGGWEFILLLGLMSGVGYALTLMFDQLERLSLAQQVVKQEESAPPA